MILIVVPDELIPQIDTKKIKAIKLEAPINHSFYLDKFTEHVNNTIGDANSYKMDISQVAFVQPVED